MTFSFSEVLAFVGLTQCVYILVYMGLRIGKGSRVGIPALYFGMLGLAFFMDLTLSLLAIQSGMGTEAALITWLMLAPIAAILIVQLAFMPKKLALQDFWPLALMGLALMVPLIFITDNRNQWLALLGFIAGALSLIVPWGKVGFFTTLGTSDQGHHRYWLVLTLILVHAGLLTAILMHIAGVLDSYALVHLRNILGLALLYLAMTSIFRIYPQAVILRPDPVMERPLTQTDMTLITRIEDLLNLEKVYQEPAYSRTNMARELGVSETVLSRIFALHFKASLPKVLNIRRVEDAKRLLLETKASIQTIAGESGFNSLASFNRVFREEVGQTPSDYRAKAR